MHIKRHTNLCNGRWRKFSINNNEVAHKRTKLPHEEKPKSRSCRWLKPTTIPKIMFALRKNSSFGCRGSWHDRMITVTTPRPTDCSISALISPPIHGSTRWWYDMIEFKLDNQNEEQHNSQLYSVESLLKSRLLWALNLAVVVVFNSFHFRAAIERGLTTTPPPGMAFRATHLISSLSSAAQSALIRWKQRVLVWD